MDYMSRLYQNKAIQLQEQINFLEAQLKYMAEDAPASTFSGTGKGQQAFSDSQLEDQMKQQNRTGMFGAKIEDDKQNQEYKDAKAELDRRRGAKPTTTTTEAPAQVSGTNRSDPDVQRGQFPVYPAGQSDSTYTKPKAQSTRQTPDTLDLYNLRKKEDSGLQGTLNKGFGTDWLGQSGKDDRGELVTVSPPTLKPVTKVGLPGPVIRPPALPAPKDSDSGMDPKGLLLGLGGGLYAGNKIREYINRQRVSPKPANLGSTIPTGQDPVKPTGQDPVKPSGQDGARPTGQDPVKPTGQDPVKPKVQDRIPKSGSWTFDLPAQAEYMQNPPEWSMPNQHGRAEFPGLDSGGRTPTGQHVLNRNTAAGVERAKNTPIEGRFGPANTGEPPVYPAGSYSTPEGKVVTPQAAPGTRMSGSQVTGKIPTAGAGAKVGVAGKIGKGVGRLGVDLAAMYATGDMGEKLVKSTGAGESVTDIAGSVASVAPMLAGVGTNAAVATGYVAGRLIDKGVEASGLGDITRREQVRAAMAKNAEAMKGVSSLEDAQKQAQKVADQAKRRRSTDLGKGFATPEESAEFAKKMQDPSFRAAQQSRLSRAQQREYQRIEGGFAVPEVVGDLTPDWVNAIGEYDPLGKATNYAIETIPGAKWATGKAGEAINWLSK